MALHDHESYVALCVQFSEPNEYNGTSNNVIGITWYWCQCQMAKSHVAAHFDHCQLTNAMVLTMMALVSIDQKSLCTLFNSPWTGKQNGAIDNAISVMWCSNWYQWHQMAKRVISNVVSIVYVQWTKCCIMAMLVLMESNDWKSHVSPHFDLCNLMNAMVPLTTPLASQKYVNHCLDMS